LGTKKIKISKKEALKAQKAQESAQIPIFSREWLEEHASRIFIAAGALLLILGILWGYNAYAASKERRARLDYAKVLQNWPVDENSDRAIWEQVAAELEGFVKEHSGTPPAQDAQLDLARACFQSQQFEKALQWNKKVLDEQPRDDGFKLLAQYQLAATYKALGRVDDAIALWGLIKSKSSPEIAKEADWNLAGLYAGKGEYTKAVEHYESALKASGGYPGSALIQEELASVKLKFNAPGDPTTGSQ
jgi:predicted negative regulator of RcsB-dependent stress response